MAPLPTLKPQEIPFDHPDSNNMFVPTADRPFVVTPSVIRHYTEEVIVACLCVLQAKAVEHDGLDYLQVFAGHGRAEPLWFIEDGPGGAITALLPSDY